MLKEFPVGRALLLVASFNAEVVVRANALQRQARTHQHLRGDTFQFPEEAEQNVLRADVIVLQADRLLACHRENLPHPVREVVIHGRPFVDQQEDIACTS